MKIKNLVAIFGLSLALGVGAAVGAVSNKAVEVRAGGPVYLNWDGGWSSTHKVEEEDVNWYNITGGGTQEATVSYSGIKKNTYACVGFGGLGHAEARYVSFKMQNTTEGEGGPIAFRVEAEGNDKRTYGSNTEGTTAYNYLTRVNGEVVYTDIEWGGTNLTIDRGATLEIEIWYAASLKNLKFCLDSAYDNKGDTSEHSGTVVFSELLLAEDNGQSGDISVDMTHQWAESASGQNISILFENKITAQSAWGTYQKTAQHEYVTFVSYDLEFTPSHMTVYRYNSDYDEDDWKLNPKNNEKIWNWTNELMFTENSNVVINGEGGSESFFGYAYMEGIVGGKSWGRICNLTNVKLNGSKHVEYFTTLQLVKDDQILVFMFSDTYGWRDGLFADNIDATKWSNPENNNVKYNGDDPITVSVYFDRNAGTVYITDATYAAADEYAQEFLEATDVCDATGVTNNITSGIWDGLKTKWIVLEDLHEGAQKIIKDSAAKEDGNYIEKCAARYDYIVNKYGSSTYENFMNRTLNPAPGTVGQTYVPTNSGAIIISVIAATFVAIAAGTFFITKKKHD